MTGLDVGTMDREVTIQALTDGVGSSGFPVETWVDLCTVWMARLEVRGSERFRAAQLSAPIETRWHMHYLSDMDPNAIDVPKKRRLVYLGRPFDITSASEIGRQVGIELLTLARSEVEA